MMLYISVQFISQASHPIYHQSHFDWNCKIA